MKKKVLVIGIFLVILAVLYGITSMRGGVENESEELTESAQAQIQNLFGDPQQFVLSYLPQDDELMISLIRSEVWFYHDLGKKLTFLGGNLISDEEYIPESQVLTASGLSPGAVHFDLTKEEFTALFGAENIDPVDYLPGLYEAGVFETYLTDKAIVIFEQGKLTFLQTFGLGDEKEVIEAEAKSDSVVASLLGIKRAEAKIRIKNAFKCFGKACRFIVELPDKITRPLGPVVGPIVSTILTKNIAKHKNLGKIFGKARRIDSVIKDVNEQKELVSDVQKLYRDAATDMIKTAGIIRESRKELLGKLTEKGNTYKEYKANVLALEELAKTFEAGAAKFGREADKTTFNNVLKMVGRDLVNKVFGQAKNIVLDNVGKELTKLINPEILDSLISQNERGADAVLDILISGDIVKFFKDRDSEGVDVNDLKKRVREEIKAMLKANKEDLKKNWKNKIAELLDKNMKTLLEGKDEATKKQSEMKESAKAVPLCEGAPEPASGPDGKCPSGYRYDAKSGVECVQKNCYDEAVKGAHWDYTGRCQCGTAGSIDEKPTDPNKACRTPSSCSACPGCVYACVPHTTECPAL